MAGGGLTYRHIVLVGSGIFLLSNALIVPDLHPIAGLVVILGCIGSLYVIVRLLYRQSDGVLANHVETKTWVLCGIAAILLCVLGGEGHFFFANYDWLTRDAVLADLVGQKFPVSYSYQGNAFVLRAPLGMYMIPSEVGKLLGLHAAHLALLAQNAGILALTLSLLMSTVNARRTVWLAAFLAFSGIEILGALAVAWSQHGTLSWPVRAHQHLTQWNPWLQYTNHVAQIFWVPNHALPGWWLAALSVLYVRRQIDHDILFVSVAFLLFWSPLAVAGALPVVAYLILSRGIGQAVTPRALAASAVSLCFLPIAIYLLADAEAVPHQWIFSSQLGIGMLFVYCVFVLVQIPHAAIIAAFWQRLDMALRTLAILSIALLLLIPMYWLGMNNDFVMRASITPLALLAFVFSSIVAELQWHDGIIRIAGVATIAILGCIAPALEIQRTFMLDPFAISDCNLLTTWNNLEPFRWWTSYLAKSDYVPRWLFHHNAADAPASMEDRQCWPDHPYHSFPTTAWGQRDRW